MQNTFAHRYAIAISVCLSTGLRELLHEPRFEFESKELERGAIIKDGKTKYLSVLEQRIKTEPSLAKRIGGVRFRIRGRDVQAL